MFTATRIGEGNLQFNKIDLDTEEIAVAHISDLADARPAGISITDRFDPYNWTLVGIVQSPDRVGVWHLDQRTDWIMVQPESGVVEANRSQELTVAFSSEGIPGDTRMDADLVFTHDGVGGEVIIPVEFLVVEGGITMRELNFNIGWNLISLSNEPSFDNMPEMFAPLVERDILIIVKDEQGRFFLPAENFNNMEAWNSLEGYMVKVAEAAVLENIGDGIPRDTEISLTTGWNIISYLPRFPIEATTALSGLGENLIIAKDGFGEFYIPAWDYSNMGEMREGQGYLVNVSEDAVLVYTVEQSEAAFSQGFKPDEIAWVRGIAPKPSSFSLLLLCGQLKPGTRLEAFTEAGFPAGRGIVDRNGRCGIALWGDDPLTKEADGFREGETPIIGISGDKPLQFDYLDGWKDGWQTDGWAVGKICGSFTPDQFGITSTYPNPFNGEIFIEFQIGVEGNATIDIFDISGRKVTNLMSGKLSTGKQKLCWQADNLATGIYLVKLASNGKVGIVKIVLVK